MLWIILAIVVGFGAYAYFNSRRAKPQALPNEHSHSHGENHNHKSGHGCC